MEIGDNYSTFSLLVKKQNIFGFVLLIGDLQKFLFSVCCNMKASILAWQMSNEVSVKGSLVYNILKIATHK